MALRAGPITWEVFRRDFRDHLLHREKKEVKVEEFINLCKGGMSVQQNSLKFTKLSKYDPSFVSKARDEMYLFITRVPNDLVEDVRLAMLHDIMNISIFIVNRQHVEKTTLKRKNKEFKKAKSYREILPRVGLKFKTSLD